MGRAILGGVLLLLTAALVAGACGGSEEEAAAPAQGAQVKVEQDDFFFKPEDLSGEAGTALTVELENKGQTTHTFTIAELNVDEELAPGEKTTVTFTPTTGGGLVYFCRFHRMTGMEGTLTVSGGSAGAAPTARPSSPNNGGGYGGIGY